MIWTVRGNVSFSHDLYILQDLIEFCLWFKRYGVDLIDEVHMAEQGWLIGELVQEGQLAFTGLAVVDLQHVSQVL